MEIAQGAADVTPSRAIEVLRKKKREKRPGPKRTTFTISEIDDVRTMAAQNRSQLWIADQAGLTLAQFKKACESDDKLVQA